MSSKPKIIVSGALGKMGSEAVKTFLTQKDRFEIIGGLVLDMDMQTDIIQSHKENGIELVTNLQEFIHRKRPDIMVEFTTPASVFSNSRIALLNGVRPVIGATGLSQEDINELSKLSEKAGLGAIIAPNFSLGAVLMMRFAKEATKYFDKYEIIELHHDKKLDAPSGTAIKTASMMEDMAKAYPLKQQEIPIHSVRLPGLVANQEVIFGAQGQTLTIKHETIDRSSFMPGIVLACEKVMKLNSLVYGLENII
jgi:4-hydroxy-tetrahydrodipicolinate reductase